MVTGVGRCKSKQRRGEEHGFIVGVGDEEDDGFVGEVGMGGSRQIGGEKPKGGDEDGDGEDGVVVHCGHYRASSRLEQPDRSIRKGQAVRGQGSRGSDVIGLVNMCMSPTSSQWTIPHA